MNEATIGKRIAALRRERGLTQGELAETLGVSAQAVSKWETDTAYPDITLLPTLADELGTTVDGILRQDVVAETRYVPAEERKSFDELVMRIRVQDGGDKVKVNLPLPLLTAFLELGLEMGGQFGIEGKTDALKNVDFTALLALVEKGALGKLVEVEGSDGELVEIYVD